MKNVTALKDDDPRVLSAYTVPEAALYLRLPLATLRSWVAGRTYPTREGRQRSAPVLDVPPVRPPMLSFVNLVEAHVLTAITRQHSVPLQSVRRALHYLQKTFGEEHPLIDRSLLTDRRDLFIQEAGQLINVTRDGQTALRDVVEMYLHRIEWDESGLAARLYPFTGRTESGAPRAVLIDPRIAFGRPVLVGTSVPTHAIAERFKAGESPQSLAADYGREPFEIWEAIRCELDLAA